MFKYKVISSVVFNTDYATTIVNYTTGVEWTVPFRMRMECAWSTRLRAMVTENV